MNKTTKIIAATLLTLASSASFAKTEYAATGNAYRIGDNFEQGHVRSWVTTLDPVSGYRVVIQFNVRSTNKSQYNAMYLDLVQESVGPVDQVNGDFCESVEYNLDEDAASSVDGLLVTYLPYSPNKEVHNNEEWFNDWRSVLAVVHVPGWLRHADEDQNVVIRVCSRDKNGDVVGDLDDFEIKDIVIHYQTEDEEI